MQTRHPPPSFQTHKEYTQQRFKQTPLASQTVFRAPANSGHILAINTPQQTQRALPPKPAYWTTQEKILLVSSCFVVLFLATDYAEDSIENAVGLKDMVGKNLKILFLLDLINITPENLTTISIVSGVYAATLELLMNVGEIWESMQKDSIFPIHSRAALITFIPGILRAANLGLSTYFFITDPKEGLGWSKSAASAFSVFAVISCFGTQVRESYFTVRDWFENSKPRRLTNIESQFLVYVVANLLTVSDSINDILLGYIAAKGMLTVDTSYDYFLLSLAVYACVPFFLYSGEILRDAYQALGITIHDIILFLKKKTPNYENIFNALKTMTIFSGSVIGVSMIADILTSLTFASLAMEETALPFEMTDWLQTSLQFMIKASITSKYTHASIIAINWFIEKFKKFCNDSAECELFQPNHIEETTAPEPTAFQADTKVPSDVSVSVATNQHALLAAPQPTLQSQEDDKPRESRCARFWSYLGIS